MGKTEAAKKKTSKKRPSLKVESEILTSQTSLLNDNPSETISIANISRPKIVITVKEIDRILETIPQKLNIKIIHMDALLLDEAYADSKLEGELEVDLDSSEELSKFLDNPILIKLETSPAQNENQMDKDLPRRHSSSFIGLANFDMLPLLNGTTDFVEEILVLYPPNASMGIEMKSWPSLPTITVQACVKDFQSHQKDYIKSLNVFDACVECIYNVPKHLKEACNIIIYLGNPVKANDIMKFTTVQNKYTPSVLKYKTWATLDHIDSYGKMSKYHISNENHVADKKFDRKSDQVEYFSLHRRFLDPNETEDLKRHIKRKLDWFIDIILIDKNTVESSAGIEIYSNEDSTHLRASLDCLLFLSSGDCRIHAAVPIDINVEAPANISESDIGNSTSIKKLECQSNSDTSKKLKNSDPMWIVVDISLPDSFSSKEYFCETFIRICKQISSKSHLRVTSKPSCYEDIALNTYINNLARILKENYLKFIKDSYHVEENEINLFKKFLKSIGIYREIISLLANAISVLISNAYTTEKPQTEHEFQECLAKVFMELSHRLNIEMVGLTTIRLKISTHSKSLLHFAYEAEILQDYLTAERYYLERIVNQKDDPNVWFDYGVFLKRVGDFDKAHIIVRKVLQLDSRHKYGLLVFGMFLMLHGETIEAEKYFMAATNLHPEFTEGWIALHLYYLEIESYKIADFILKVSREIADDSSFLYTDFMSSKDYIGLYPEIPSKKHFLRAASLFIKLGCFQFAELALAKHNIVYATSSLYHYLCALVNYFQGNYIHALRYLHKKSIKDISVYYIHCLKGYCYIKMKSIKDAIKEFETVKSTCGSLFDTHLVDLRLGCHYFDIGDFGTAAKVYLNCCNSSPTPRAWLGAGKSLLRLCQYDDYVKCLIAASKLDYNNVEVWACLSLFFMCCNLKTEYEECYIMALKNGLTYYNFLLQMNKIFNT